MAAWLESSYGSQPHLLLGEHTVHSCTGVQQGDPLGPLGFALALQPLVEEIKLEVPTLKINVWYLDDGTLCGSPSDLMKALRIIQEEGPPQGLILNHSKSLLFIPTEAVSSSNSLPADIPVCREGFHLLGSPSSFCNNIAK